VQAAGGQGLLALARARGLLPDFAGLSTDLAWSFTGLPSRLAALLLALAGRLTLRQGGQTRKENEDPRNEASVASHGDLPAMP
jgi:hypothetical protein